METKFKVDDIIYDERLVNYYRILFVGTSKIIEQLTIYRVKNIQTDEKSIFTEFYMKKYCSLCTEKSINILFKEG